MDGPFDLGVSITETVDDDKETHIIYYSTSNLLQSQINQMVSGGNEKLVMASLSYLVDTEDSTTCLLYTSRAEYRLLLRQDNADLRLRKKGWEVGLVDDETYAKVVEKERLIAEEIQRVENTNCLLYTSRCV